MSAWSGDGRTGGAAPRRGSAAGVTSARGIGRAPPAAGFLERVVALGPQLFDGVRVLLARFLSRHCYLRRDFRRALRIDALQPIERRLHCLVGRRPLAQAVLGDDALLRCLVALGLCLPCLKLRLGFLAPGVHCQRNGDEDDQDQQRRKRPGSRRRRQFTFSRRCIARPAFVEHLLVDGVAHAQRAARAGARCPRASATR